MTTKAEKRRRRKFEIYFKIHWN